MPNIIKWPLGILGGLLLLAIIWPPIERGMRTPSPSWTPSSDPHGAGECSLAKWTWSQSPSGMLRIEGVVSNPERFERIHIQVENNTGGLVGTDTAYLKPGGAWLSLMSDRPSVDLVTLKFACD